jgi:hypothetical protein
MARDPGQSDERREPAHWGILARADVAGIVEHTRDSERDVSTRTNRVAVSRETWPDEIPAPQAWLEFDVDSVERATTALAASGYRMLVKNKKEPWGRIVSRFLSPEGLLLGITFTPSMREERT